MEPEGWSINVCWAYLLWALWVCVRKLVNSSFLSSGNTVKLMSLLLFYLQFIVWKLFSSNSRHRSSIWEPRKASPRGWVWECFQVSCKVARGSANYVKSHLLSLPPSRTCHRIGQQISRATSNRFFCSLEEQWCLLGYVCLRNKNISGIVEKHWWFFSYMKYC